MTISLEHKKKVIAEKLMGWEVDHMGEIFNGDTDNPGYCLLSDFTPEKGGKDLAEVLERVQWRKLYGHLPKDFYWDDRSNDVIHVMELCIWFQNPDNAPKIFDAIFEVVENNS